VLRIHDARAERLSLGSDRTNQVKWAIVLLHGIVTQLAIALVHLERPRAHVAALTVFSLAAVIALGLTRISVQRITAGFGGAPAEGDQLDRAAGMTTHPSISTTAC
jgi:membrane protein YdbS with pleckstrin-like domain